MNELILRAKFIDPRTGDISREWQRIILRLFDVSGGISGTISVDHGGTGLTSVAQGDILYASAVDTLAKLNKSITASFLSNDGASNNPSWTAKAALTRVDDTNVTLTLGGSHATALLAATSITAGWTGQLSLARGGSGKALTAANGAIAYSDADSLELLAPTATAGQVLRSGSNAAPSWSTATYPATTTVNQLLYSTAANVVGGSANLTFDGTGTVLVGDGTTGRVRLGGATSSFPMLRRTNTFTDLRLADDSAFAPLRTSTIQTNGFTLYTTQALTTSIGVVAADTVSISFRTNDTTANGAAFGHGNTGNTAGNTYLQTAGINQVRVTPTGRVSIGGNANAGAGTAWLHLPAGTTAASAAPLKFTSGSLQSTAEAGAVEFLTDKYYATITTSAARKELTLNDAALTSGTFPVATTNGRLTNSTLTSIAGSGSAVASYVGATAWTPAITFATPGDLAVTYSTQVGYYSRVGNTITAHFALVTSAFTHTTAAGNLRITGLPVGASSVAAALQPVSALEFSGITKAGYTNFTIRVAGSGTTHVNIIASGSGVAQSVVAVADVPSGASVVFRGTITYEV